MITEDRVRAGDTLGRYELLTRVARGGMAAVWAARHHGAHGFSKIVALKTMLPELSDDPDFQRMFLTEARVAARIRHPNIVETLDLGEERGLLYLVMEWIDGEMLSAVMRLAFLQKGVPLPIAVRLIVDACAGVHAAHELCDDENQPLGVVHRDVSPPNILISYSGVVKLGDFGIAKMIELNTARTLVGQVKGKLRYMAPEQFLLAPIDRRTDIFALGVSLYQLTTGQHPWPGDTAAVIRTVLSEPPTSPRQVVDGYPAELERIVLKALAREPADRFQSAADMAQALEDFARDSVAPATTRELGAFIAKLPSPQGVARREAVREAVREADSRNLSHAGGRPSGFERATAPSEAWADGSRAEALSHASLPPWTSHSSAVPSDAPGPPYRHSDSFAELVSRARPTGTKGALFLGAAVILTGAYALGGRQASGTDAGRVVAASTLPPRFVASVAQTEPAARLPDSTVNRQSDIISKPVPPAVEAPATSTATLPREQPRPPAPSERTKRPKIIIAVPEHPKNASDPDVGF